LHGIPKEWSEADLFRYFRKEQENITQITIVRNRLGVNTGKALIVFDTRQACDGFIANYHEQCIETEKIIQKISVKAFQLKTKQLTETLNDKERLVYLAGLPYDCSNDQLFQIASEFG